MKIQRLLILLVLLAISANLHAQRFNTKSIYDGLRDGQWESSLLVNYQNSGDYSGDAGSSIDIDSAWGWGFTIGYNLTAKWNFNFKFAMNEPDYTATIVPDDPEIPVRDIDYTMTKYASSFNATYNFLEGPLTPFVQAGLGWTRLDSNIPNEPPSTGCWWDPWWGYICNTTWSTYETTDFSYNAGLGLRWDVNGALFMRGAYNREWIDLDNGTMDFDVVTLEAGLMW